LREISAQEIASYRRDGAAVLRGIVAPEWIERMRAAIDRVLARPASTGLEYTPEGEPGRYYGDFFLWRRDEDFRAFMAESCLPELAARVMESRTVRFFYDQLLVKEPGTREATPWHHDLAYWPLRGEDILSVWVPFDRVTRESGAVVYIPGSQRTRALYAPAAFGESSGFGQVYEQAGLSPLPDIETEIARCGLLGWELEVGDVVIHHPRVLHHAPGNASSDLRRRGLALRYVGDDVVFDDRPGTFLDNPRLRDSLPPLSLRDGEALGGPLFPRVWPQVAIGSRATRDRAGG